nr:MAG TPA: hypothetical protein [Caudoviricetes sp.]
MKNFHFNTDISKLPLYKTSEKLEKFWKFSSRLPASFSKKKKMTLWIC